MKIEISSGAEADVADGYWFYKSQSVGLGDYFRSCIFVDIEPLRYFGGIHEIEYGFHRSLSKRFPFGIYYTIASDCRCRSRSSTRTALETRIARRPGVGRTKKFTQVANRASP